MNKHQNIVMVFPDQMRGQSLGFLGEDPVHTPNLDRFAEQSLVLPQAISNAPICSPFRAMLMTGKYPLANQVTANCKREYAKYGVDLQEDDICWSDILKSRGYSLGYIGKWHLDLAGFSTDLPADIQGCGYAGIFRGKHGSTMWMDSRFRMS